MSDLFSFDSQTDPILDQARANSVDSFDDLDATASRGLAKGVGLGIMRGGAGAARAGGFATAGLLAHAEFGSSEQAPLDTSERAAAAPEVLDPLFSGLDEYGNSAIDYWTPRPNEVGKVGQILGGLGEIVLPLAAAGGNPVPLIATQELGRAVDLSRAGVDSPRAVAGGAIAGAATAAGLKIPILGSTLTSRLATGAAGNVAFGAASRTAEHALLSDEYPEQAPPILDMASLATDALTGLLFGGLHHTLAPALNPRLKPSEVDAILTARTAKSFGQETTPGAPDSITAEVGHQSALEEALTQLARGEPVDVSGAVGDHPSTFTDNGHVAESVDLARLVAGEEPTDVPYAEPRPVLTDTQIEERFRARLTDKPAAMTEYAALEGSDNGRILNTDLARELSPDYVADRTRSAAVHEPASALVKEMYAQKLAEDPAAGQDPLVVFSAGGTGAGKSVGLNAALEANPDLQRAQIVYDTNLNRLESATQKIDQALAAGKRVHVIYTARDPVTALTQGALPRAMRMGRTVPLVEHAKTHVGAAEAIGAIAEHYKDDQRVTVTAVDNTGARGEQRIIPVSKVAKLDYNATHEALSAALEAEFAAGRISDPVYQGTAGRAPAAGSADSGGGGGGPAPRDHGELVSSLPLAEALKAAPEKPSDIPEVAALQSLADETPNAPVYLGVDANGEPVRSTLADASEQIQREYDQDLKDAQAYHVAVSCFLGHGA